MKLIQPNYSEDEIKQFSSLDEFMDATVEFLKQTIELIDTVIISEYYDENEESKILDKEEAIVGGNMVRLFKLNVSLLQNVCEGKLEICYILNRCLFETGVNLIFFLTRNNPQDFKNYLKNSLIEEKALWNILEGHSKGNNNIQLAKIQLRMKESILCSFKNSGFELDEINKSSKWKSLKQRAESTKIIDWYSIYYGMGSHSIHGNWQDILSNNLKEAKSGFLLNLDWKQPRPMIMDGAIGLNIKVIEAFAKAKMDIPEIKENCKILNDYSKVLVEAHEKWLETICN